MAREIYNASAVLLTEDIEMLKIKDNNVQIPISLWEELKNDFYFNELIEALEDRQDLLNAKQEADEFFDFREYDEQRLQEIKNV